MLRLGCHAEQKQGMSKHWACMRMAYAEMQSKSRVLEVEQPFDLQRMHDVADSRTYWTYIAH